MNAIATWETGDGVVEFPDGRRVRGRGLLAPLPNGLDPQFGFYLLGRAPAYRSLATPLGSMAGFLPANLHG